MRERINKTFRHLAAAVIGLLGFSSCGGEDGPIVEPMLAYASPYAVFKASGEVKDQNGKPIEGIRVAITEHIYTPNRPGVIYDHNHFYYHDTLFTDSKGSFLLNTSLSQGPYDVTIVFEDVDGDQNGGNFKHVEVTPPVKQIAEAEPKKWFNGAFEVEAKAIMKK